MRVWAPLLVLLLLVPVLCQAQDPDWPEPAWRPLYTEAMTNEMVRRLIVGYEDFNVRPEQICSRYEWAAVVSRLVWFFHLPLPVEARRPPDVPWQHWAEDATRVLVASGIYPGPPDTRFCGDKPLTRAQFAWMFANLFRTVKGEKYLRHPMSDMEYLYTQAAEMLRAEDLMIGYPYGKMHLDKPITRWQVCLAVSRLLVWSEQHLPQQHIDEP